MLHCLQKKIIFEMTLKASLVPLDLTHVLCWYLLPSVSLWSGLFSYARDWPHRFFFLQMTRNLMSRLLSLCSHWVLFFWMWALLRYLCWPTDLSRWQPAYAVLSVQTREIFFIEMWAGQMLCEAFNWVLKHTIKQERPNCKWILFSWL